MRPFSPIEINKLARPNLFLDNGTSLLVGQNPLAGNATSLADEQNPLLENVTSLTDNQTIMADEQNPLSDNVTSLADDQTNLSIPCLAGREICHFSNKTIIKQLNHNTL